MSTQIRFDIEGLHRAIESGDACYQLALYANNAEVSIIDLDDPTRSTQVLQGKSAIANWIEDTCRQTAFQRVVNTEAEVNRVALIEECQTKDGANFHYACTADVRGGQITRETVQKRQAPAPATTGDVPGRHGLR